MFYCLTGKQKSEIKTYKASAFKQEIFKEIKRKTEEKEKACLRRRRSRKR